MHHTNSKPRALRGAVLACALTAGCAEVPVEDWEQTDAGALEVTSSALARSSQPPASLSPSQVPQFVSITFDDNFQVGGMNWATELFTSRVNPAGSGNAGTFDAAPVRASFYHNCTYLQEMSDPPPPLRVAWQSAVAAGHETGDHTQNHREGLAFTTNDWVDEIVGCRNKLMSAFGLTAQQVSGFRAPFLMYNDALYSVLETRTPPFAYDTSIPSCLGASEDGTNCAWPYTLDVPSVDAAVRHAIDPRYPELGSHVGFWEIPNPVVIVPVAMRASVPAGAFDGGPGSGKILGMDINMFYNARLDRQTALATLKNTLDLHLAGNRSPLVFVAHTHVYDASWDVHGTPANLADRRAVLSDFIDYALSKPEVRMRPVKDILAWMKNPVPLGGGTCTPSCGGRSCGSNGCGGSCGTCAGNQTCSAQGQCLASCTPSCGGRSCGTDGCGGSCGTCAGNQMCSAQGQCIASCVPSCSGRTCGTDNCGGSCGTCSGGQTCSSQGQCTGGGGGDCGAPFFSAGTNYVAGDVVRATCTASTVGTACYQQTGKTFAFRCDLPHWCTLAPGSDESGWWSAWSMRSACN